VATDRFNSRFFGGAASFRRGKVTVNFFFAHVATGEIPMMGDMGKT